MIDNPWNPAPSRPEWLTDELQTALLAENLPLDADGMLMLHQRAKAKLDYYKELEMDYRKITVKVIAPSAHEGTNTVELGNGYAAKVVLKFNYSLLENSIVEKGLDEIASTGNEGAFIAERLVSWHPTFSVAEYRLLQDDAEKGSQIARDILKIVNKFLVIKEASPTLEIKAPKQKK